MNTLRSARRLSVGTAVLAATLGGVALTTTTAKAANPNDYELLAAASALDINIQDNSLPVTQVIEASPFGSTASVSSSGVVKSTAGAPFAPFVYSLPRTSTGLGSGNLPPIPSAPGFVASSFPVEPAASQKTGGYELTATTAPSAARGEVKLGSQPAGSANATGFAISEAKANEDGSVAVSGSAGNDLLSFGGIIDVARVSSTVALSVPSTGKPAITSTSDLGTVTFASTFTSGPRDGTTFVAGQPTPLSPANLEAVNTYLKPYGLTFTYLPQTFGYTDDSASQGATPDPKKTVRSVVSGGLLITTDNPVPTQGQVSARYTLGRVSVSATNIALPAAGSSGTTGSTSGATTGLDGTNGTNGTGATNAAAAGAGGLGSDLAGAGAGTVPDAVPGTTTPTTAGGTAGGEQPGTVVLTPRADAVAFVGDRATSSESFYLMLVLAAAVAIGGAQLIRFFAVKA